MLIYFHQQTSNSHLFPCMDERSVGLQPDAALHAGTTTRKWGTTDGQTWLVSDGGATQLGTAQLLIAVSVQEGP